MVFDPNTLCWVDDGDMQSSGESTSHYYISYRAARNMRSSSCSRYEPSSYRRYRTDFWKSVWDKFQYCIPVLAGMILGFGLVHGLDWVDDKYSIRAKVKAYFSGESEVAAKDELAMQYGRDLLHETSAPQTTAIVRLTCCSCGTVFDFYRHRDDAKEFWASCPSCYSNLRCEIIRQ